MLVVELPIAAPADPRTVPIEPGAAATSRRRRVVTSTSRRSATARAPWRWARRRCPTQLPVLPLRDTVTFPDTLTPLAVGQERSIQLVNDVLARDRQLVMVGSSDPEAESPAPGQLYRVGVVGTVARMLKVPDGTLRILVQGGQRVQHRGVGLARSPTSSPASPRRRTSSRRAPS